MVIGSTYDPWYGAVGLQNSGCCFDSRTLKFDFFNGAANFAVTTRKYFFLLFFNFCS